MVYTITIKEELVKKVSYIVEYFQAIFYFIQIFDIFILLG